jgi:hypothetical protein
VKPEPAVSERAVRNTRGFYDADQKGLIAFDGAVLRYEDGERAWSPAWIGAGGCPFCPRAEYLHLLPGYERRCREHPVVWPDRNPFPLPAEERLLAEERYWLPIASRCEIPERYRTVRLEESTATPAVKAMRAFLARRVNRCFSLAGPTGIGKTHAMVAAFRELAVWDRRVDSVAFYTEPQLVRLLISSASEDTFERAAAADLLAIDDVGSAYRKPDGLADALLEELFVRREANEALTFVSTNLTRPRFAEVVGDRVADRIAGEWGEWINLPGRSLRRVPRPEHQVSA